MHVQCNGKCILNHENSPPVALQVDALSCSIRLSIWTFKPEGTCISLWAAGICTFEDMMVEIDWIRAVGLV